MVVVHWRLTAAPSPHPNPPPDPPASLQRGIITEIDNVKNSFQKHFLNTRPHLVPRVKHEILSTSRAAVDGWRRFSNSFQFRIVPLALHLKLVSSKWEYEILCLKGAEGLNEFILPIQSPGFSETGANYMVGQTNQIFINK